METHAKDLFSSLISEEATKMLMPVPMGIWGAVRLCVI